MFASQLLRLKKTLGWTLVLVGLMSGSSMAVMIVDLPQKQPLGAMSTNAAGDVLAFSLGNGRALLTPVTISKKITENVVRDLLLRQTGVATKVTPIATKRLRRNLKW